MKDCKTLNAHPAGEPRHNEPTRHRDADPGMVLVQGSPGTTAVDPTRAGNPPRPVGLRLLRFADPVVAVGTAVLFIGREEPFARQPLGAWVDTLHGQIARDHYFFTHRNGQIVGYCGWALASHASARDWIDNRRVLSFEACKDGPCALLMAFRALDRAVNDFQVKTCRTLFADREVAYWLRLTHGRSRLITINLQADGVRRRPEPLPIEIIGAKR